MKRNILQPPKLAMFWLIRRRQALLVLMFVLLHTALLYGPHTPLGRILMLPHLALFLLWQPFVNAQSRVTNRQVMLMCMFLIIAATWLSWPIMALWLMLLAGMVGGRVFFYSQKTTRAFYMIALLYLVAMLLLFVMPQLLPGALTEDSVIRTLLRFGLPGLVVAMALVPESREQASARETIDLVYSVFIMLMLAVITLGSIALMLLQHVDYLQALLIAVFAVAAMLLVASWLWNPGAGFTGLGAVASRYMLSIGLPFEQWLRSLTELAQRESDPARFIDLACRDMVKQLPWVSACTWADDNGAAVSLPEMPIKPGLQSEFRQGGLTLTLTTQQSLAPVMVWHFNLVTQMVARFYEDKKRDRQLREMAYMQAIHETGARVTHDVKNLLQSLHALLFVIGDADEASSAKVQPLLRRQLPLITERLQQTLDKLQIPDTEQNETAGAGAWWRDLRARYETREIRFRSIGELGGAIPASLFNSAAENLLQNALEKRAGEAGMEITVTLDMQQQLPTLAVTDTGSPLPDAKAAEIGQRPVASENGLGIGLYQLARIAAMANYGLELSANRAGDVCFTLAPKAPA